MENIKKFFHPFFLFAIFIFAVLIFSGCSKTESSTETAKKTETTTLEEKETAGSDAKGIFAKIIAKKIPTYMVEYDVRGEGEFTKMTLYSKSGKIRYDMTSHGKESSLFWMDNKAYSCTYEPKMCIVFSGQQQQPKTGVEDIEKNINNYKITAKPSRVIAGVTAKCFEMSSGEVSVDVCYSNEGVPLYTKSTTPSGEIEMTAKDYSTSVSDSVFTLPAEPQDISAMMEKYKQ